MIVLDVTERSPEVVMSFVFPSPVKTEFEIRVGAAVVMAVFSVPPLAMKVDLSTFSGLPPV